MQAEPPKADPPKRKRRWFQYSLRSVLIFTVICAVAAGWLGKTIERKRQEREAVAAIIKSGGRVWYDYQIEHAEPRGPKWLRNLFGENLFSEVDGAVLENGRDVELAQMRQMEGLTKVKTPVSHKTDVSAGLVNLKGLAHLESLYLRETNFNHSGLSNVEGSTQLRQLLLGGTNITDAGLVHLQSLRQLQELDLWDTDITDAGLASLRGLAQLRYLNLVGTGITDSGLVNLKELTRLKTLDLANTSVGDVGLTYLKSLPDLQDLYLGETSVTDAGLVSLKGLTKLQHLNLPFDKVTDAAVKDLSKSLPNCTILRPDHHRLRVNKSTGSSSGSTMQAPKLGPFAKSSRLESHLSGRREQIGVAGVTRSDRSCKNGRV
jgi:internalin A